MKTKMVVAMLALLAAVCSFPDLSRAGDIPADSERLHARFSGRIQPSVRSWITLEANKLRGQPAVDENRLRADIAARFKGQNPGSNDIEAVAFLVMMQATRDADSDLKATMEKVKATNESRRKLREEAAPQVPARNLDSMSEMSEMNSMQLQMMMDRRSKFISTLSNMMKKISTTQETLVQNLK